MFHPMSGAYYKLANQERENHVRMFYVWKRTFTREWFDNDEKMVELLSRLAVKVRFITKISNVQKYFRIFFKNIFEFLSIFFFIFELGWNSKKKILVRELNEPLKCQICSGYLINPTVVNECQHTFCKTVSRFVTSLINHLNCKSVHFNPLWRRAWLSSLWNCFSSDNSRKIYNKRWNFTTGNTIKLYNI